MARLSILLKNLKDIQGQIEKATRGGKGLKDEARKSYLASKVKGYRIKNGLSQEDLAKKLGVGRLAVIRWEKAKSIPSKLAMKQLIKEGVIMK